MIDNRRKVGSVNTTCDGGGAPVGTAAGVDMSLCSRMESFTEAAGLQVSLPLPNELFTCLKGRDQVHHYIIYRH